MQLGDFGSLRFRVSVLLLLSTLNTILLSALVTVLLAAVNASPAPEVVRGVRTVDAQLGAVQDRVLAPARPGEAWDPRTDAQIDELGAGVRALGAPSVTEEYVAWKEAVEAWRAHVRGPLHVPSSDAEDATGEPLLAEVKRARNRLSGTVHLLVDYERPAWLEGSSSLMPVGALWIFGCSAVTVWLAWSLQRRVTEPLGRLVRAAEAVADGRFELPAGDFSAAAPEIAALGEAMNRAREKISRTIGELDTQNRRVATMLEQLHDGVILTDHDGRIVEANAQAERILTLAAGGFTTTQTLPDRDRKSVV